MKRFDRKTRRGTLAAAALVAAIAVGTAVPAAFAQEATELEDASETTIEDRRAEMHEEYAAALAEELGVDVDRVSAALEAVRTAMIEERRSEHLAALEERLDAAVETGGLTQEQADAILEAHEAGALGGLDRLGDRGRGFGHGHRGGFGPM